MIISKTIQILYSDKPHWLTGRVRLYHGTAKTNIPSIMKDGLLKSKANDANTITKQGGAYKGGNVNNLIYTHTQKSHVSQFGNKRHKSPWGDKEKGKTLKLSIPVTEYNKMRKVADPEVGVVFKNKDDLAKLTRYKSYKNVPLLKRRSFNKSYDWYKGTKVIKDSNISAKHIKGSPDYKRVTLKEILNYQKSHFK